MAGGATCRRGASAARVLVDGGGSGQRQGTGGVAGDGPPRRHDVVAVRLGFELRLLLGGDPGTKKRGSEGA